MTINRFLNIDAHGGRTISFFDTFVEVREGLLRARVHPDKVEPVRDALFHAERYASEALGGRGSVYQFPVGEQRAIVRRYQRGGAVRHLLKDGYFFDNRPLRELQVWCYAYESDVPVPLPLGVMWYRRGPLYYGAIAAQYIASGHLQAYLGSGPENDARREVLVRAGQAIRDMHARGIVHADLQVRNILIEPEGTVLLIDFDNARKVKAIGDRARYRNLLRLRRSFEKNKIDSRDFEIICEGYGVERLPKGLSLLYSIKGKTSSAVGRSGSRTDKS